MATANKHRERSRRSHKKKQMNLQYFKSVSAVNAESHRFVRMNKAFNL